MLGELLDLIDFCLYVQTICRPLLLTLCAGSLQTFTIDKEPEVALQPLFGERLVASMRLGCQLA